MDEVLKANGNNNYKLPHISKAKTIRRSGRDIPLCLPCTSPLPLIHHPFATPAVGTAVPAAPATVSPTSSPTNSTHFDGLAGRNDSSERENEDDSLMGNGGDGDEDDDEMGIDWEDPHEEFESAWI